ncbi:MAG TPA: dTDP-4-dehydrorhamnose reductase [Bryobacteraceae bacterium]|nr:dTDP-4-dehydrorhamnose reductase [Bryobacteraceae bacterium]
MADRALIFGAKGQLGVELGRVFRERGYDVTGFERADVDICDAARVERIVADRDPRVILNAAAYNMVDVAEREPQAAYMVNGLAVRNLAIAARQADASLVHFSTDYVFDGTAGRAYTEEDQPHPLGAYAVSKLAGELYAQAYLERPLIIRTSGVFGPAGTQTARGNFLELMLRLASGKQPIRVVEDHVASPAYAPALAERTADLLAGGHRGLFHVGGGTPISWFDYARLIFEVAGLQPELRATSEREYRTPARRPKYSALSNGKMESVGVTPMPPLREAVKAYLAARERAISHSSQP